MARLKHRVARLVRKLSGREPFLGDRALARGAQGAERIARTVAAVFVASGLVWVVFTDILLYRVIHDRALVARIETAKGWIFVCLAGVLLYVVVRRSAARLAKLWRLNAAVVESIADGVLLIGRDRVVAYANAAAARLLRCSPRELVGMGAAEFARRYRVSRPNGSVVRPEEFISERVFGLGGPLQEKAVLHLPGGEEIVVSATAAPVRLLLDGPADCAVTVLHDITEADKLERMRDSFFAAAAHSLKTPVAVIKANVQALLPVVAPRQQSIAASLERQCDRIDRLVQNLLVLVRARSETLVLYPDELEVLPFVERIARERVWSHRHQVRPLVTGSPRVYADQERLALVVRNLMYEASRLSVDDSPLILQARPEGDGVAMGVRYRPLPSREQASELYDEYDDIGIGRSVTTTIVQAHGGSVREEAAESEVATWICLPAPAGAGP